MTSIDVNFWKTEGINYFRWSTGHEYYEGEENVKAVMEFVGDSPVRDVGCGYGRLAKNFNPLTYIGFDICESAVKKATRINPSYRFLPWNFLELPPCQTTMFINGPHLVNDQEIDQIILRLCENTNTVVLAEIMERSYRGIPYPYGVYHRSVEEYDKMFEKLGFVRTKIHIGTHFRLNAPYTVARWDIIRV